ncbi:MAG: hypothetical protein ACD_45C00292G0002 [uncultured bacterium]|nr:MAG: hypothetical protein ACD_45C00292G0002 [uncultured bacterium]
MENKMDTLQDVFDKWATDLHFKKKFKENPQQALKMAGIKLSDDDLQKILATISKQEELEKKINR